MTQIVLVCESITLKLLLLLGWVSENGVSLTWPNSLYKLSIAWNVRHFFAMESFSFWSTFSCQRKELNLKWFFSFEKKIIHLFYPLNAGARNSQYILSVILGCFAFAIKPNQGEWGLTDLIWQQRRLSLAKGVRHPCANGSWSQHLFKILNHDGFSIMKLNVACALSRK